MARDFDPYRLSNPSLFLTSMVVFLIITGFLAAVLYRQIFTAFQSNPGLNGLIIGVLVVGILLALAQVIRLIPEVKWVNSFRQGNPDLDTGREPVLLAPMKSLLGQPGQDVSLTALSMRSILDSIGNRLDESRDISRYLIGLLVFLGLLGTFWGLLQTIGSIGDTIRSLSPGSGNTNDVLDALKSGLSEPLDGMATAFSSSLFGLAGSLVLGFLDLQAGRSQTRFYTELENWLSSVTDLSADSTSSGSSDDVRQHLTQLAQGMQNQSSGRSNEALVGLVDSIQQMVKHMRKEQEITRQTLKQQEEQQEEVRALMRRLNAFFERASRD